MQYLGYTYVIICYLSQIRIWRGVLYLFWQLHSVRTSCTTKGCSLYCWPWPWSILGTSQPGKAGLRFWLDILLPAFSWAGHDWWRRREKIHRSLTTLCQCSVFNVHCYLFYPEYTYKVFWIWDRFLINCLKVGSKCIPATPRLPRAYLSPGVKCPVLGKVIVLVLAHIEEGGSCHLLSWKILLGYLMGLKPNANPLVCK